MRGDPPAAALRLSQQLPVREHRQFRDGVRPDGRKRVPTGGVRGGLNRCIVEVAGVRYPSKTEARRVLGIGYYRMEDMLRTGEARHV